MTYPKKRVVIAERYLHFYDYDEPKDQLLTDETVCLRVVFLILGHLLLIYILIHNSTSHRNQNLE